jgi:beta-lactamase class A
MAIAPAENQARKNLKPLAQNELQALVDQAVTRTLAVYADKKLTAEQLAITAVDLTDYEQPVRASYRGGAQIYPASVIKMFYLVAAQRALEDGKIADTPELRRAMHDMIVHSYNEPTGYIIDLLTGTTSGPELSPAEMEIWHDQRNAVNRYFQSLGYTNINVNKKPWCEGPYGREQLAVKTFSPSRNWLNTDAAARLLTDIVTGKLVSPTRCEQMMELLKRDPAKESTDPDDQARVYTAKALPVGAKLWSKAGWMSTARHDAAYVELPNGARFVLVIFTVDHSTDFDIIPTAARVVVEGMSARK